MRDAVRRMLAGRVGPVFALEGILLCLEGKRELDVATRKQAGRAS